MLQSENSTTSSSSSVPLWSIDRKMTRQITPRDNTSLTTSPLLTSPIWDSKPIGKSIYLRLCQHEQLSPQLILEDKVFRSAIRLQHGSTYRSQLQFVGTLIVDDETQRLTYVIDRLQLSDSLTNDINSNQNTLLPNKQLNGEFIIPIRCEKKNLTTNNTDTNLIQEGIKMIENYCQSSLPIELHHFSFLHGQMYSRLSPSINADISFDLLTIKNNFKLTPINSEYVQILPTALLKNLSSSTGNSVYINQPHFGYCGLDRMSKNKILLILENDPQACALPLVGIWVSGIVDVQCAFVWAACLRYCMNSSLKQRLRPGNNVQQPFLLACYLSTSRGQCDFYEVHSTMTNSTTSPNSFIIDYDLWTSTRKIIMPNPPTSHSHDTSVNTQLPYDFEFRHVYDGPKMHALLGAHTGNISISVQQSQSQTIRSTTTNTQLPSDISFLSAEIPSDDDDDEDGNQTGRIREEQHHHTTLSSPNTNGSLFGVPRLPPKQSSHQSPSWDSISTPSTMATPKWITPVPTIVPTLTVPPPPLPPPPPMRFSSPAPSTIAPSTIATDAQWKEEMLEKMQAYDAHIQSLNALIAQLLTAQQQLQQQNSTMTSARESTKCDVAVQSEPPSPCTSDDVGESASMVKSNRNSPPSPKIEQIQHYQQQTPIMSNNVITRPLSASTQFQSPLPPQPLPPPPPPPQSSTISTVVVRQPEPIIDYASLRKTTDCERITVENTPVPYHHTPVRSISPPPQSTPADLNPVDILKPFFQFMATQQQKQQQQQQHQPQQYQHSDHQRSNSSSMTASKSFDTALIKTIDEESGRQAEKMSQLANVIQQQQQQVTSTTTTGISFISNGLQMQIINQQSSTTTVYPPVPPAPPVPPPPPPVPPISAPTASLSSITASSSSSAQQSENDLSIEVRSLQMKYLDDDQLAISNDYDRQSPTPPSTVRQSPQIFDKNMSFATQKYFQKYNIVSGYNRPQQYYLSTDDSDILTSSSPPQQRMLLPLPTSSSPPIFTQPPLPHAPQAKILDLSQIRKLPKLL